MAGDGKTPLGTVDASYTPLGPQWRGDEVLHTICKLLPIYLFTTDTAVLAKYIPGHVYTCMIIVLLSSQTTSIKRQLACLHQGLSVYLP